MKVTYVLSFLLACIALGVESEDVVPTPSTHLGRPDPGSGPTFYKWNITRTAVFAANRAYATPLPPAPTPLPNIPPSPPTKKAPTTQAPIKAASKACEDSHAKCPLWAKLGECRNQNYAKYMATTCKKSCGYCGATCRDSHYMCGYWAKAGQCKNTIYRPYMITYCRYSCGECGTVAPAVKPSAKPHVKPPVAVASCYDSNPLCGYWYAIGECSSNARYMQTTCKRSCGLCTDGKSILGCRDSTNLCKYWASVGECQSNSGFMNVNCRVSCKLCVPDPGPVCRDGHVNCKSWAKKGECTKNPSYMSKTCAASCKKC